MGTTYKPQLHVPLVDLAAEYCSIEEEIAHAVTGVLKRGDFVLGEEVRRFERDFADFCEVQYAVAVSCGLSALELALRAHGIGPGDEVVLPANTFVASALAVSAVGAKPVLVDIDEQSYNIDVGLLNGAITGRTAAIMPVHLYGQCVDMDAVLEIARARGLVVIEDACQAHGARYRGARAGSMGNAAAFSFYPAKNLGAYGDAGIVVTNDSEVARFVEMSRNYGQTQKYHHVIKGNNQRMDTLQAAVLRVKLKSLEARNAARRRHADLYKLILAGAAVELPVQSSGLDHVWHLFVVRTPHRDELMTYLAEHGIHSGIHYPIPIHLQEAYRDLGHGPGSFPVTEMCANQILSLPMYPELTDEMIWHVAGVIKEFVPERV